jgi:hypothetical protein
MPTRVVETAGDGMRVAMALFELGLEIQRQNLRREFPYASEPEIERRLAEWLLVRRGAERGDAEGRVCDRDFAPR